MVILVGADRLGNIEQVLKERGYDDAYHVAGRNPASQRKVGGSLLNKAQLMVLFTDFVGHNVARNFKQLAKENGLPFVACRRSTVSLCQALDRIQGTPSRDCSTCNGCEWRTDPQETRGSVARRVSTNA